MSLPQMIWKFGNCARVVRESAAMRQATGMIGDFKLIAILQPSGSIIRERRILVP
jgi:hypothetical protein